MCGISGIFRLKPEAPLPDPGELARIHQALAHRGPDGEGVWKSRDGRLLLAHRRLAILDLSPSGAQPMTTADGRFTIVFNGEVYNFRTLAGELQRAGVSLRSASDTEVILELYRREKLAAFARLRGMFALAIWDELTGALVLARDPYGIKPLYYSVDRGVLRFASQVRALEAGGGVSPAVEPAAIAGFLSWGAVPEPFTLRRAIRELPAGKTARTVDESIRIEALPPPPETNPCGAEEALRESVRAHLVSDVPVGIFLSAGLDSGLVAALAAPSLGEPLTAITLTWTEARGTNLDEAPLAAMTARKFGLRHVVREISGAEVREACPAILAAMDQPSIDGFNTWLVARVASEERLKVALSGLGGDELLGGYPSFRDVRRWNAIVRGLRLLPGIETLWGAAARSVRWGGPKLAALPRYADSLAGAYVLRRAIFLPHEVDALLERAGLAEPGRRPYYAPLDAWECLIEPPSGASEASLRDTWAAVHRLESSIYLRQQLLRDADWAGMAHSVEIRVPLVDDVLRRQLAKRGFEPARSRGKAAAIHAAAPDLPESLFRRRKTGFQLPIADWLDPNPGGQRSGGTQARRLALLQLERFGVSLGATP